MSKPTGHAFAKALEEAGVVTDLNTVERIVVDIDFTSARVYVQRIGDKRLLDAISGPLGMMLAEAGNAEFPHYATPKAGARYHVLVSRELLDADTPWESAGLHLIERGDFLGPDWRWCLFEDDNAPEELNGKKVELTLKRGRRHEGDLTDSTWVADRQVIR